MSLSQKKFRELVLQLLYSLEFGNTDEEALVRMMMKELSVTKRSVLEALERVRAIQGKASVIDDYIAKVSQSYSLTRIQSLERNILRLAGYELLFDESIPPKVAITEAVRLTRKFGTPEGASFVNALLDEIYHKDTGEEES